MHQPQPDGGGRVVARAPRNGDVADAPVGGKRGPQPTRARTALNQARHVIAGQVRRGQQLIRPIAFGHIQPKRARRVGHFRDVFARQPKADIILGQQNFADLCENLWLMLLHPPQLGRGEARHDDIATEPAKIGTLLQFRAFGVGAAIVPQDCRAQGPVVRVKQCGPVHLARHGNAAQRCKVHRGRSADLRNRGLAGGDP